MYTYFITNNQKIVSILFFSKDFAQGSVLALISYIKKHSYILIFFFSMNKKKPHFPEIQKPMLYIILSSFSFSKI